MLIFDGYALYISTKAIEFCTDYRIVLLYFLPHTIYLLQLLDVGIFEPLVQKYRYGVYKRCNFGVTYSIDKVDFLEVYRDARTAVIIFYNIKNVWRKTGLLLFDSKVVLS